MHLHVGKYVADFRQAGSSYLLAEAPPSATGSTEGVDLCNIYLIHFLYLVAQVYGADVLVLMSAPMVIHCRVEGELQGRQNRRDAPLPRGEVPAVTHPSWFLSTIAEVPLSRIAYTYLDAYPRGLPTDYYNLFSPAISNPKNFHRPPRITIDHSTDHTEKLHHPLLVNQTEHQFTLSHHLILSCF